MGSGAPQAPVGPRSAASAERASGPAVGATEEVEIRGGGAGARVGAGDGRRLREGQQAGEHRDESRGESGGQRRRCERASAARRGWHEGGRRGAGRRSLRLPLGAQLLGARRGVERLLAEDEDVVLLCPIAA